MRLLLILSALLMVACGRQEAAVKETDAFWTSTVFDVKDQPVALVGYRDRPLVVNFWARWCPPCRDEIPDFISAREQFKDKGVELLGIGIEDQAEPVREFAQEYRMTYPVLLAKDQGFSLMTALGNREGALPFTVVIDRHGNVVGRKLGRMSRSEMDAAFAAAQR